MLIGVLVGLVMVTAGAIVVIGFIAWVARQTWQASQYRELMRSGKEVQQQGPPPKDQWTVKYRYGGKRHTAKVSGQSEKEVIGMFVTTVKYETIDSIEKG